MAKKTYSRVFWDILSDTYPTIACDPAFAEMCAELCFGTRIDKDSGLLILPHTAIARIERKTEQLRSRNYVSEPFLRQFSDRVVPIEWTDYDKREGRARKISAVHWESHIGEAIEMERDGVWNDSGRVSARTGRKWSPRMSFECRSQDRLEAKQVMDFYTHNEIQREFLSYFLNVPSNHFNKTLREHYAAALSTAKSLQKGSNQQIDLLACIYDQSFPTYKPVGGSMRIFPLNESMLLLQRDVRKALAPDWVECDLVSAQLAICAKEWGVHSMIEFLSDTKNNVWKHLCEVISVPYSRETKGTLKPFIYSLCFGATQDTLGVELEELNLPSAFHKLKNDPLVSDMLAARKEQLAQIMSRGGAFDCYGRWIEMYAALDAQNMIRDKDFSKRSVLAQCAQAWELKLLYPILQLAKQNPGRNGFTLLLFQHDGFSFVANKKENTALWTRRIKNTVDETAKYYEIPTRLEVK